MQEEIFSASTAFEGRMTREQNARSPNQSAEGGQREGGNEESCSRESQQQRSFFWSVRERRKWMKIETSFGLIDLCSSIAIKSVSDVLLTCQCKNPLDCAFCTCMGWKVGRMVGLLTISPSHRLSPVFLVFPTRFSHQYRREKVQTTEEVVQVACISS